MSVNDGVKEWWESVPIATRYMFSGAGILTLAANFGLVSPMRLLWFPQALLNFEVCLNYYNHIQHSIIFQL